MFDSMWTVGSFASLGGWNEINLVADCAIRAGPVLRQFRPRRSCWEAFVGISLGFVIDIFAFRAFETCHHDTPSHAAEIAAYRANLVAIFLDYFLSGRRINLYLAQITVCPFQNPVIHQLTKQWRKEYHSEHTAISSG